MAMNIGHNNNSNYNHRHAFCFYIKVIIQSLCSVVSFTRRYSDILKSLHSYLRVILFYSMHLFIPTCLHAVIIEETQCQVILDTCLLLFLYLQ